jgi:hypothetical protein
MNIDLNRLKPVLYLSQRSANHAQEASHSIILFLKLLVDFSLLIYRTT